LKRCLLTGASGFLGGYIYKTLSNTYEVVSLGRSNADVVADLSNQVPELQGTFDLVVHSAGLAHTVPATPEEEKAFFDVNLEGTRRLCVALEKSGFAGHFVFISTVAVYGCEQGEDIAESHPKNGKTPYALSKIQAEELLEEKAASHGFRLTTLRLPLIVGKNAPGNLQSMSQGIASGRYASIAGGKARKSMVLAQDVATLIGQEHLATGVYNLTDQKNPSFRQLEGIFSAHYGKSVPRNVPLFMAKLLGIAGDILGKRFPINSNTVKKITSNLTFNDDNAVKHLNWNPNSVVDKASEWLN